MSALPRPELPPGPARALNDALHDLHHQAGWPSLRALAAETGVSHTTVSKIFSRPTLPTWGTLELLVEAMGGDTTHFHDLWLAASTPTDNRSATPRIAGRRNELDVVRRHLEAGTGLLLVTGEAGMGKSALIGAACHQVEHQLLVATGHCLPLNTQIPLLPFIEALRRLQQVENGRLLRKVLDQSADYVTESLGTLLPEVVGMRTPVIPDDPWARQRLFSAVGTVLQAFFAERPGAVVLEDLHWGDDDSLDLVEHLVRTQHIPILATWRSRDPDVDQDRRDWWHRSRRAAPVLELSPLTLEETREQLVLMGATTSTLAAADKIHARSQGQPLFTEQLSLAQDGTTPAYLGDLLDDRVARLRGDVWQVASVLGVADSSLPDATVAAATGLGPDRLAASMRELTDLWLLGATGSTVHLRHPLLAEAVRRRLLPGERAEAHRRLARAMSEDPAAEPAVVATHWGAASRAPEELVWRIRAAAAASALFAGSRAADQWLRVLELWPEGRATAGDPPIRRYVALAGAAEQLLLAGRNREVRSLIEPALASQDHVEDLERADLLRQLALVHSSLFTGSDAGLRLVEESIALYRRHQPTAGLVHALNWKAAELEWHGRRAEAVTVLADAIEIADKVDDVRALRAVRAQHAWQLAASGDESAVALITELARALPAGKHPWNDLYVAVRHTDILLMTCASAAAVEAAALPALDSAKRWNASSTQLTVLVGNVAQAWRRAGNLERVWQLVADATHDEDPMDLPFLHVERAFLELCSGDVDSARRRLAALSRRRRGTSPDPVVVDAEIALALWTGSPSEALRLFSELVELRRDELSPGTVGDHLAQAARAAADRAGSSPREDLTTLPEAFRARLHHDPFTAPAVPADRAAGPQFAAEVARLEGRDTVEGWLAAVRTWDDLDRPHDAAYARWRAAQCALRAGQGTVAAQLLKRAATDAREHVPLSRAIAGTAAR